jgi:23S rRNA pseudouridine2605 synthase
MAEERLQKFLAAAGIAARRKAEEIILAGRVKVNGRVVTVLGTKVDPEADLVTVDGAPVLRKEGRAYYLLYKPPGCITTAKDPQGRPTALEYLSGAGVRERVFAVGRLDYDAEGALLFTDDGELANRLSHPRYGHRRVYLVKVKGDPPAEAIERMKTGVRLEDGPAQAVEAAVHDHAERNVWLRIVVGEGRFHLVKRLCEAVGLEVQRLFRPEFGGITVEGLRPGRFRPLSPAEVRGLRAAVGLASGPALPAGGPRPLPKAARRHGHGPPPAPGGGGEPASRPRHDGGPARQDGRRGGAAASPDGSTRGPGPARPAARKSDPRDRRAGAGGRRGPGRRRGAGR